MVNGFHPDGALDIRLLNSLNEMGVVAEQKITYGGDSSPQGFRDLRVWQVAIDLLCEAYRISRAFPKSEHFNMTSQLKRAALSVSSNIAEGWGKNSNADFARYCDIANESLCETQSIWEAGIRLDFLCRNDLTEIEPLAISVGRMLHRLREALRGRG